MKKAIWWIIGVALSPFILFIILTVLLYLPPVQRWAVGVAADYASEAMGMSVSVGDVRLRFPLDLELGNVLAIQRDEEHPQLKDTVLDARSIVCDVQLMPLLDSHVELNALQLDDVKVNTVDLVEAARVKGRLGHLLVTSHCIDLSVDSLLLNSADIRDGDFDIALSDSVPEDTTESENDWRIRLQKLTLANTSVRLHMPGDTLMIGVRLGNAEAVDGLFDLGKPLYSLRRLDVHDGAFTFDNNFQPVIDGFDTNHIAAKQLNIGIDSLFYTPEKTALHLRAFTMKEKGGLQVSSLTTHFMMDTTSVHAPDLHLLTPNSDIKVALDMDLNAMDADTPGQIACTLDASIGKPDILILGGAYLTKDMKALLPAKPMTIAGTVRGNMKECKLIGLDINVPTYARAHLDGALRNLDAPERLTADVKLNALTAGRGTIKGTANYNAAGEAYAANLSIRNLNVRRYDRTLGVGMVSADVKVKGRGMDVLSPSTTINATARLHRLQYDRYDLTNCSANVLLAGGRCHADIHSDNRYMQGEVIYDGVLSKKGMKSTLSTDIKDVDLLALGFNKVPMNVGVCSHIDIESDFADYYKVQGLISDLTVRDSSRVFRPDDMVLSLLTRKDTTLAVVDCGDFHLDARAQGGYKRLMGVTDRLTKEIMHQLETRVIDQSELRRQLPVAYFKLTSGGDNPLARALGYFGFTFSDADINLTSSPVDGLNGYMAIDTLRMNKDLQLDRIDLAFVSDAESMTYKGSVVNGRNNPQVCFRADIDGRLINDHAETSLAIYDDKGRKGVDVALAAMVEEKGIRIAITPKPAPVLGYKSFTVNEDNYILLGNDMRVSADMRLKSSDGMGIQIYSDDDNLEALQDLTLSLHNFELYELTKVVPYMPKMSGRLDGDFHAIITPDDTSVSSNVQFTQLVYDGCLMGNIGSEFVYMPKSDGSHYIDGTLTKDDLEIGTLEGLYYTTDNTIDAQLSLTKLPLELVNGFIPERIFGLQGTGDGSLNIHGSLSQPEVNGEMRFTGANFISEPYGVKLRIDESPVRIINSHLLFEDFKLYAANNKPMTINGDINFADLDYMTMDMRMVARDFMIIDSKETRRSEAYGRGYVNFFCRAAGQLDRLQVTGKLDVLAKSDIYYILRESPITTDNRLKELVTFTDLNSETPMEMVRPTVDGMNISMSVSVAPGTHIKCWMNTAHSNYLDLIGEGDLRMTISSGEMALTGRYTINEGEMKYSLPVIPLKTFKISDGSYLEFTGDMMNPTLNITAQETTKANVNTDGTDRLVEFNCGVVITKTLKDMGLQFIIDAPEEQSVHDELMSMSLEDRGKLAVTMLTTGMYLSDGNTSAFSMNSALSSFLQSEINNIAGSALRTLDMSFGMENSTDEYGAVHTDYSFKFAKRFWNNRLAISVGGKISSGPEMSGQNKSFFDNVEVQYRLGDDSNQYLRLFYNNSVYDYLEGYSAQYGAGYMWKRKLRRFADIFRFSEVQEPLMLRGGNATRSRMQNPLLPQRLSSDSVRVIPTDTTRTNAK